MAQFLHGSPACIPMQSFANVFKNKKETLTHLFCCEFCEISKNTFFLRTPPATTSMQVNVKIIELRGIPYRLYMLVPD